MDLDAINLGAQPGYLLLHLTTGSDFACTLRSSPTAWTAGTALTLVLGATTWTATITDNDAIFDVDKAIADTIPDRTGVRLVATNGSTDQVLATGRVVRHG